MPKEKSYWDKITIPELKQIGKKVGLKPEENKVFASFWKKRFPNNVDRGYASQWAERVKRKEACIYGDDESRKALKEAGYNCGIEKKD